MPQAPENGLEVRGVVGGGRVSQFAAFGAPGASCLVRIQVTTADLPERERTALKCALAWLFGTVGAIRLSQASSYQV